MVDHDQVRVLDDPEVLRLIADPLRLRLLELLRQAPRTVTELAEAMGVARTRLYYHIRLLEEAGLVTVAETHLVAGITEKRYRVTAYRISVDRTLLGEAKGGDPLDVLLSVILDEVASEIRHAVASGLIDLGNGGGEGIAPGRLLLGRNWYRLSDEEVVRFAADFDAMWKAFADRQVELPGGDQAAGAEIPLRNLVEDAATDPPDQPRRLYERLIGFYPVVPPASGEGTDQ